MNKVLERIKIRHIKKSDVEGIWINFNEVVEEGMYLPVFFPVLSVYEKKSWYNTIKKEKEICIVAEHRGLKSPYDIIGQCEISNSEWDAAAHVGSLGIIVKKKFRDMGIGTQLIDMAIREAKRLNNKEKIVLSCFSSNESALHLYERLGFQAIGLKKSQFYIDSKYYDEVLMELFIEDYIKTNPIQGKKN